MSTRATASTSTRAFGDGSTIAVALTCELICRSLLWVARLDMLTFGLTTASVQGEQDQSMANGTFPSIKPIDENDAAVGSHD